MNPPSHPSEITAFEPPPSPSEFPMIFRGGGGGYGYFLEPHNGILGLPKVSKFWGGAHPQTPPRRRELKATFWKSRLLYSDQLAASVFIETPETV